MNRLSFVFAALLASTALISPPVAASPSGRNVVIFVADGLRYDSVTPETAPTMARIRAAGVDFANSHSAYPTLTTVNASVIATGHLPGDTGNYANTFYVGFPVACAGNAPVAFVENNCILKDIKAHFPADYLAQTTLIEAARKAGLNTVLVGKRGPLAIQYLPALDSQNDSVEGPQGIFMDEATGKDQNSPALHEPLLSAIKTAAGAETPASATAPNLTQQAWQNLAVGQVLLPKLKAAGKPFVLLYWSRDPDITQHAAADSEGKLIPGINATSDRTAIYNADTSLKTLLDGLKQYGLDTDTDVIVIADHGFSTIAKALPTPEGNLSATALPDGFLAKDVAAWLGPDAARVRVVSNGNAEYLYIDGGERRAIAKTLAAKLTGAAYTGGIFVNDALIGGKPDDFAGALPMSDAGLIGSSKIPQPALVVALRTFVADGCTLGELMCAVELSDTSMNTGHGNHGSPSRADTRNFMAAIGPDFKTGFKDETPVGNVDVAHTAAKLLGLTLAGPGKLKGRVASEALTGGTAPKTIVRRIAGPKTADGIQTVLQVQEAGGVRYIDAGGIPGRMVGIDR